jgi:hypothetical protein
LRHLAGVKFSLDLIPIRVACHSEEDIRFTKLPHQSHSIHVPTPHVLWPSNE